MASIADLKKQSSNALEKLQSAMKETTSNASGGKSFEDTRLWKPFFDKTAGVGQATVRFLPTPDGEDLPWVKIFTHGFKGPSGKWYIENSLTTIGQNDPVGELNSRLWNSGIESDKEVARDQKRKTSYYSNVYIVDDPANPANNGKVFLFRYGQKIFDKLQEIMVPQFEDEEPCNPFSLFASEKGCDFVIRMRTVSGFVNYDKSSFKNPSDIGTESEIEEIWNKAYSLEEFVPPNNFKTYDELKNRMFEVLGPTVGSGVPVIAEAKTAPIYDSKPAPKKQEPQTTSSDSNDDDLKFFEDLAAMN